MSNVRAKFVCTCKTVRTWTSKDAPTYEFEFCAVTSCNTEKTEENKSFWDATPSGSVKLQCVNQDLFEVGKTYYLDFTEAPE